jgi:hypothetical protein
LHSCMSVSGISSQLRVPSMSLYTFRVSAVPIYEISVLIIHSQLIELAGLYIWSALICLARSKHC